MLHAWHPPCVVFTISAQLKTRVGSLFVVPCALVFWDIHAACGALRVSVWTFTLPMVPCALGFWTFTLPVVPCTLVFWTFTLPVVPCMLGFWTFTLPVVPCALMFWTFTLPVVPFVFSRPIYRCLLTKY
jgi:hypothetical protein